MTNNALKKDNPALTEVQVIARNDIPAIHSITQEGVVHNLGELRDFQWHDILKDFLPSNKMISFSWVRLKPGESLAPHEHPMKGMIIIIKGSARLTGQKNLLLKEGDVVITPPYCSHGFDAIEESYGLSIQFEEGIYTDPENARVRFLGDEKAV
jgi:mannose-6-phosphate isomerase-like protein (cupin superfamily)